VVGGGGVAIPGSDATSQDVLDGAAVEPFEDLRTHANREDRMFFFRIPRTFSQE
jgi:hypothetical protein